ncbi:hypothetical protein ABK040_010793 [Willaertia magna]
MAAATEELILPEEQLEEQLQEELSEELDIAPTTTEVVQNTELTTEQNEVLKQFSELLQQELSKMTPYQRYYCFKIKPNETNKSLDNACLIRYLKARDFEIPKAHKLLWHSLNWMEDYKPHLIRAKNLSEESSTGKLYCSGYDKMNRPIVYMIPRNENTKDGEKHIQLLAYTLLSAINRMELSDKMTWICDFEGTSMKSVPSVSDAKKTIEILSSHFPERLGMCFIVNPPKIFGMFYKLVSGFIPPITKSKIKICYKKDDLKSIFEPYIDLNQLDKRYGGLVENKFNHDEMWKEECELDEKRFSKLDGLI